MTRSVSRPRDPNPSMQIGVIGYIVAAASFFILLPLLPFLAIIWAIDGLRGGDITAQTVGRIRSPRPALDADER